MFSLEQFREKRLELSKQELADKLNITVGKLELLEQNPHNIEISFIIHLSQVVGYSVDEIVQFKPIELVSLNVEDSYAKWSERILQVKEDLEKAEAFFRKPKIAFMGPSDAGKSTLINSLCGQEILVAGWTPMTSSVVHLKHAMDKPIWLGSDEIIVLGKPLEGELDYDLILDEKYCNELKIASGKLCEMGHHVNRNSEGYILSKAYHTLIFVDAPILKTCDLLDSPGYGTEVREDTEHAKRVVESMEAMIYVCQSNGFLNKKVDIEFFCSAVKHLSNLQHLFVVASQAHLIGEENVPRVMERAVEAVVDRNIHQTWSLKKDEFRQYFVSRFFTYSLESMKLRARFEQAIGNFLELDYPKMLSSKVQKVVTPSTYSLLANSLE